MSNRTDPIAWSTPPYVPKDRRVAVNSQEWVRGRSILLVGADKFFAGSGVGPSYEWPLPDTVPRNPQDFVDWGQQSGSVAAPTEQFPVSRGGDRLVPKGPARSISLYTFLQECKQNLTGLDLTLLIVGQPAMDLPRGPEWRTALFKQEYNISLGLPGQDDFPSAGGASVYDWPNPQPPLRSIELLTHTQDIIRTTLAPVPEAIPEGQQSFDMPVRKYVQQPDALTNLFPSLVSVVQDQPFGEDLWPIPRGPQWPIELTGYVQGLNLLLYGQDEFFSGPALGPTYDWPNPRLIPFNIEQLGLVQRNQNLEEPPPPPPPPPSTWTFEDTPPASDWTFEDPNDAA